MIRKVLLIVLALGAALTLPNGSAQASSYPNQEPTVTPLVEGLGSGSGSTVGPDGALYVAVPAVGEVARVDPETGDVTTYATGLPPYFPDFGFGGVMDVAFLDGKLYALVTLVGSDWGGDDLVGIYRMDGPGSYTVVADLGQWSIDNPPPPTTFYDTPTGVQYAMQPYRGGFIVTDGHHNRVLRVELEGDSSEISQLIQFENIIPTGLELKGKRVYIAQAGPVPHLPEDGKIVSFKVRDEAAEEVASGGRLMVDVEFGPGRNLYGLSQGFFTPGQIEGSPADPDTGALMRVECGELTEVVGGLNRPTSLEFIGKTAYVVTLGGEVLRIDGLYPGRASHDFDSELAEDLELE